MVVTRDAGVQGVQESAGVRNSMAGSCSVFGDVCRQPKLASGALTSSVKFVAEC